MKRFVISRTNEPGVHMRSNSFNLPDGLYRLLPGIYIGSGVLTLLYLSDTVAVISGFLLLGAGLLETVWRGRTKSSQGRYRNATQLPRRRRATARTSQVLSSRVRWE